MKFYDVKEDVGLRQIKVKSNPRFLYGGGVSHRVKQINCICLFVGLSNGQFHSSISKLNYYISLILWNDVSEEFISKRA